MRIVEPTRLRRGKCEIGRHRPALQDDKTCDSALRNNAQQRVVGLVIVDFALL